MPKPFAEYLKNIWEIAPGNTEKAHIGIKRTPSETLGSFVFGKFIVF
jgi:hypothetical protein